MKMKLKWQRGEVDVFTVAVSMAILSIIAVGTGAGMIYGRDALLRQEVAKQVAYRLRGQMENEQQRLDMTSTALTFGDLARTIRSTETLESASTEGLNEPVVVTFVRSPVQAVDKVETSSRPDFYIVNFTATWEEPGFATSGDNGKGPTRTLRLSAPFIKSRQG